MFGTNNIVATVVGGPFAPAIGAIVAGLTSGGGPQGILGALKQAVGQLEQALQGQGASPMSGLGNMSPNPMPFSMNSGGGAAMANPMSAMQGMEGMLQQLQQLLQQLTTQLQSLLGGGQASPMGGSQAAGSQAFGGGSVMGSPAGSSSFAGGSGSGVSGSNFSGGSQASGGSSLEDSVSSAGSKIDDMFAQAEKLMSSDKPSDQLKAQMLMQKAQRMFEAISKLLEQKSKAQSTAISNIK